MRARKDRMAGQALPLALLLAAAIAVMWRHLHEVGTTAAARTQLTHAADAAAYSGAVVQARGLNLLATMNRAQVAHQVAMAHLATLASWAQFGAAQAERGGRGNPPSVLIGMLFGPSHATGYSAARAARSFGSLSQPGGGFAQAQARHEETVHVILEQARHAVANDLGRARDAAIAAVLAANYAATAGEPSFTVNDDTLPGKLVHHGASPRGDLRVMVELAVSPYGFLKARNDTARNPWPVSRQCPWLRHELRRRGDTRFGLDGRWQAHDTLSFHALRSNRRIGCYFREYAMGWGRVSVRDGEPPGFVFHDDPPQDFSEQDFWRWVRAATDWGLLDGRDNRLANSYAVLRGSRWAARGLPGFTDLRRQGDGAQSLSFGLRVVLSVPGKGAGGVSAVTVHSAAQTDFLRPGRRADGRHELPNLFHPYWQARLRESGEPT